MEMIYLILFFIEMWVLGLTFLFSIDLEERYYLLAMPVGIAVWSVISSLLYFKVNLSTGTIYSILLVLSLISGVYMLINRRKWKKEYIYSLCFVYITFFLFSLPNIIGGQQYSIFRGNFYDHFTYLSMGETFRTAKYNLLNNDEFTTLSDVFANGKIYVSNRPIVGLLFAQLINSAKINIFSMASNYCTMLCTMWILPILHFLKVLVNSDSKKNKIFVIGISLLYLLGFWGQINYDRNAWAQLLGIPILLTFTIVYIDFLVKGCKINGEQKNNIKNIILMAILICACMTDYPEASLVYVGVFFVLTLFYLFKNRKEIGTKTIVKILILPIIGVLIYVAVSGGVTIEGCLRVLFAGSAGNGLDNTDVYLYTNKYWAGWQGNLTFPNFERKRELFNFFPSLIGYYFATPVNGANIILQLVQILVCCIISVGSILMFVLAGVQCFGKKQISEYNRYYYFMTYVSTGVILVLFILHRYWTAGKVIVWLSPLYVALCVLPFSFPKGILRKILFGLVGLMCVLQLYFASYRIYASNDIDGIGNRHNFPNIAYGSIKEYYDWNFKEIETDQLKEGDKVLIQSELESHEAYYVSAIKLLVLQRGASCYSELEDGYGKDTKALSDYDYTITLYQDNNGKVNSRMECR